MNFSPDGNREKVNQDLVRNACLFYYVSSGHVFFTPASSLENSRYNIAAIFDVRTAFNISWNITRNVKSETLGFDGYTSY